MTVPPFGNGEQIRFFRQHLCAFEDRSLWVLYLGKDLCLFDKESPCSPHLTFLMFVAELESEKEE